MTPDRHPLAVTGCNLASSFITSPRLRYVRLTEVLQLQTLSLLKLSLDRERIRYRVLFEYSLHVGSYLLGGSRGAIIEVVESDYPQAVEILAAEGILADGLADPNAFGKLHEFDLLTESLPVIGRWDITWRLLFLALLLALSLSLVIFLTAFPS